MLEKVGYDWLPDGDTVRKQYVPVFLELWEQSIVRVSTCMDACIVSCAAVCRVEVPIVLGTDPKHRDTSRFSASHIPVFQLFALARYAGMFDCITACTAGKVDCCDCVVRILYRHGDGDEAAN